MSIALSAQLVSTADDSNVKPIEQMQDGTVRTVTVTSTDTDDHPTVATPITATVTSDSTAAPAAAAAATLSDTTDDRPSVLKSDSCHAYGNTS
jgi:hypothetical protein